MVDGVLLFIVTLKACPRNILEIFGKPVFDFERIFTKVLEYKPNIMNLSVFLSVL